MKKMFQFLLISISVIGVLLASLLIWNAYQTHKALNDPKFTDNYYTYYADQTTSTLEKQYTGLGSFQVEHTIIPSKNDSIKNTYIFYPSDLKNNTQKYPLIMVVNGSQTPAKTYLPFFKRLSSWGFIVVGTDDPQAGSGQTTSLTLDFILNESEVSQFVDKENIGITGYSQGGAGALGAITKYDNSHLYKAIFTGSAAYPTLAKNMGWEYDATKITIPYFMTAATGNSDDRQVSAPNKDFPGVAPLQSLIDIYNTMDSHILKIRARAVNAEHEQMLMRTDGYMTAWFLYHLQNDEQAKQAFLGDKAEILTNQNWQDIEKNK
ncbi:TPA: hypothetical protein TX976_000812 [Streptococcus suis]|nr:hypothetical protein [Streptococcus suis]